MRALLSICALAALLVGPRPAQPVDAWVANEPICRMACAKTPDCCCRKAWRARLDKLQRQGTVIATTPVSKRSCPDTCATAQANPRSQSSAKASRVDATRPASCGLLLATVAFDLPRDTPLDRSRPRAPPRA